mmetsp:Transcript_13254/g.14760  ORF Transcript_13254/g.14760 Transcript_13254/m.14760 type:complete len:207 (-) Transcript_13254:126-746(-)
MHEHHNIYHYYSYCSDHCCCNTDLHCRECCHHYHVDQHDDYEDYFDADHRKDYDSDVIHHKDCDFDADHHCKDFDFGADHHCKDSDFGADHYYKDSDFDADQYHKDDCFEDQTVLLHLHFFFFDSFEDHKCILQLVFQVLLEVLTFLMRMLLDLEMIFHHLHCHLHHSHHHCRCYYHYHQNTGYFLFYQVSNHPWVQKKERRWQDS